MFGKGRSGSRVRGAEKVGLDKQEWWWWEGRLHGGVQSLALCCQDHP